MASTNEILGKISLAISYIIQNQVDFSDDQAMQVAELYPSWHVGVDYRTGQIARYDGKLYRCVTPHSSQDTWTPDTSASLWSEVSFTGNVENWKQPSGAHDVYNIGDHVMHGDVEWVSVVNSNSWEPSSESDYWKAA